MSSVDGNQHAPLVASQLANPQRLPGY